MALVFLLALLPGRWRRVHPVQRHLSHPRRSRRPRLACRSLHQEYSSRVAALHTHRHAPGPLAEISQRPGKQSCKGRTSMTSMQTAEKSFHHATRIQNSVTSGPERRALLWLAARMPAAINSDHLTVLGFAAMFLAGCSYAAARWTPWGLLLATLLPGHQLVRRQPRRHARQVQKSPAPALRFLRRPHDRLVRRALPHGRPRRLRLRRLAHRRRHARRISAALHRNLSRVLHPRSFPPLLRQIWPHRTPHPLVHRQYRFIFSSRARASPACPTACSISAEPSPSPPCWSWP